MTKTEELIRELRIAGGVAAVHGYTGLTADLLTRAADALESLSGDTCTKCRSTRVRHTYGSLKDGSAEWIDHVCEGCGHAWWTRPAGATENNMDVFQDVLEFHKAMCPEQIKLVPAQASAMLRELRMNLVTEEYVELLTAIRNSDLVGIADGAADLIVVVLGTLIAYGIDFRPIWQEVHRTNMAKQGGPVREDGKRLKPEGWQPPDIEGILAHQAPIKL